MRIALIADIHGNPLALDAVLNHIQAQGGGDGYWILGDLSAIGYDPVTVLERLCQLPNALFIRGNVDRFATSPDRPDPTVDDARQNPALIPVLAEVAGSFGWTQGYLEARGWLDWLRNLPLEHRLTLPDGTRVLLVHAAPGTDDGMGLNPGLSDEELAVALGGADEDLICVGHFHLPMLRTLNGQCIVNPGSVSNSFSPDYSPAYAILSASTEGYQITHYVVTYDRQAAIEAAARSSNPGAAYIVRCLQGAVRVSWHRRWDGVSYLPHVVRESSSQ